MLVFEKPFEHGNEMVARFGMCTIVPPTYLDHCTHTWRPAIGCAAVTPCRCTLTHTAPWGWLCNRQGSFVLDLGQYTFLMRLFYTPRTTLYHTTPFMGAESPVRVVILLKRGF